MTRDYAIRRAHDMRELVIARLKRAADTKLPFGTRYRAVIDAEEAEEAAQRFDKFAEREKAR